MSCSRSAIVDRVSAELSALLGERLSRSPSVLDLHGRDESTFAPVRPDAVVFPRSTEEVAAVMRVCAAHGVPVIAFGTGSSLEGNVLATTGGVSLDTSLMDRVLRVSVEDLDVTVQAGVRRLALEQRLGGEGVFFSVDPGADASLGGMAATAASGTNTVRYGTMRENVLSMQVVLADGRVIETATRARKSAAGYDLTHLFIGSEGTLGIITELTLRLRPIPEAVSAAVCVFPTIHDAVTAATAVVQAGVAVARCELLDAEAVRAVNAHAQLDNAEAPTLFFEFHGSPAGVEQDAGEVAQIAGAHGGSDFAWATRTQERNRLWRARHNAFFAARAMRPGCHVLTTDVCVPVSTLAATIDATVADIAELPFPAPLLGHVADGNFHALLLLDPDSTEEYRLAQEFAERLVARALDAGGTCTGEHGVGLGKRRALERQAGPALEVMRALKQTLDPQGLLNPGKILG